MERYSRGNLLIVKFCLNGALYMLEQHHEFPSAHTGLAFVAAHPHFPLLAQHQPLNYFTNESDQIDYRITHCFN
jgi:hypothetical protein